MPRLLLGFLSAVILCFSTVESAQAQLQINRVFLEGSVGAGFYSGERGHRQYTGIYWAKHSLGASGSFGLGYSLWDSIDLIGSLSYSKYPGIHESSETWNDLSKDNSSEKWKGISGSVRYRFLPVGVYEPSISMGLAATVGTVDGDRSVGMGPTFGLGISRPFLGMKLSLSGTQHYVFPNRALDSAGNGRMPDVLSTLSLGLSYRFKKAKPKMGHITITGPNAMFLGEKGIFSAITDLDPIGYSTRWKFGDGAERTGHSVEYAYASPGTYKVEVTVFNDRGTTTSFLEVVVHPVYDRLVLVSITVSPLKPILGEKITFTPLIRGEAETCVWSFGDGATSTSCETSHTYTSPGTYRVSFSTSNAKHSASSVQSLSVLNDVCSELPDLTAVYFSTHSSNLSLEMRQVLRDNMSISSGCTERPIEVIGYALSSEINPKELAEKRASEVIQYYRNLGIASSGIVAGPVFVIPQGDLVGPASSARTVSSRLVDVKR